MKHILVNELSKRKACYVIALRRLANTKPRKLEQEFHCMTIHDSSPDETSISECIIPTYMCTYTCTVHTYIHTYNHKCVHVHCTYTNCYV